MKQAIFLGLPCRLSGSWSTAQAGMKLDMKVANHSIIVTLSDLASSRFHESLLNGTWNVSGHAPFKRGSPFTLIATDNYTNSLAVFVGTGLAVHKQLCRVGRLWCNRERCGSFWKIRLFGSAVVRRFQKQISPFVPALLHRDASVFTFKGQIIEERYTEYCENNLT